jgi:F-type H+-transporting ATPase subunit delta|uniref:ATP synthase subunit delta, chloroplastic n=1 Tax=Kumanoa mahlacensis TaxID=1196387 RepID=A0A8K1YU67_9FLOR|nr:ATP synthase CF1 delta subunit [Kumanoa mahlacensis]
MSKQTLVSKIALPYAEALLELVQTSNILEKADKDIIMINNLVSKSNQLNVFFGNPLIQSSSKKDVIKQLFSGQISDIILSFLLVLVDRKRISLLNPIIVKYLELVALLESITIAQVTSAVPLTEEQKSNLVNKLEVITKSKKIELDIKTDSELIAGFKIQIGSKIIDTSLRGQLKEMAGFLEV